eukprot:3468610-Rhodomonas_salina.1
MLLPDPTRLHAARHRGGDGGGQSTGDQGNKDEALLARLKVKLERIKLKAKLPLQDRYVHPYLRFCSNRLCGKQETRPDQYHRWLSQGVLRYAALSAYAVSGTDTLSAVVRCSSSYAMSGTDVRLLFDLPTRCLVLTVRMWVPVSAQESA